MRILLGIWFTFVLVVMAWATTTASFDRDVLTAAAEIWRDPWGRATLFDAYFAFAAVYLWIAWRERSNLVRLVWLVLMAALGNFAICAYALWALWKLPRGEGSRVGSKEGIDGLFRRSE